MNAFWTIWSLYYICFYTVAIMTYEWYMNCIFAENKDVCFFIGIYSSRCVFRQPVWVVNAEMFFEKQLYECANAEYMIHVRKTIFITHAPVQLIGCRGIDGVQGGGGGKSMARASGAHWYSCWISISNPMKRPHSSKCCNHSTWHHDGTLTSFSGVPTACNKLLCRCHQDLNIQYDVKRYYKPGGSFEIICKQMRCYFLCLDILLTSWNAPHVSCLPAT